MAIHTIFLAHGTVFSVRQCACQACQLYKRRRYSAGASSTRKTYSPLCADGITLHKAVGIGVTDLFKPMPPVQRAYRVPVQVLQPHR